LPGGHGASQRIESVSVHAVVLQIRLSTALEARRQGGAESPASVVVAGSAAHPDVGVTAGAIGRDSVEAAVADVVAEAVGATLQTGAAVALVNAAHDTIMIVAQNDIAVCQVVLEGVALISSTTTGVVVELVLWQMRTFSLEAPARRSPRNASRPPARAAARTRRREPLAARFLVSPSNR
jgi:hypothetical protein